MSKGIVTCYLWHRKGAASVNAEKIEEFKSGDEVEIIDVVLGETENDYYESTPTWYKLKGGNYVWSGGVSIEPNDRFLRRKIELDQGFFERSTTQLDEGTSIDLDSKFSIEDLFKFNYRRSFDWWHKKFEIKSLWESLENCGHDVNVAILDTGIYKQHSHLKNANIRTSNIWDNSNSADDLDGHGTLISSIIVSQGEDFLGIAPSVNLQMIQITKSGRATVSDIIAGIKKLPRETDIVCIAQALNSEDYGKEEKEKLKLQIDNSGAELFICSAGNSSDRSKFEENVPAELDNTISVSSINSSNIVSSLSSKSRSIDISAPGENMKCLLPGSETYFGPGEGTSLAASYFTGFLAIAISYLKKQGKHKIGLNKWLELLEKSSNSKEPQYIYGLGIVETKKFITQIKSL